MIKANSYSHTHCQATPAHAQTKAWQRVCLANRTDKQAEEKEHRSDNAGFAKWRVQYFYDSSVQGSSSVFQMKFCGENPPLRKARNHSR
jgi:hypothetical protein